MKDTAQVFKIETFGAVDGPGVRLVIFFQGCSFRCQYCHNPESWNMTGIDVKQMSVEDIVSLYERNKSFYNNGGITISGGEPMLQAKFIKQLGLICKEKKIHLAIDTSACNFLKNEKSYKEVLDLVDLWIVDIKALEAKEHQLITGQSELSGAEFVKFLEAHKKNYWIRQVIVRGINDDNAHLDLLINFVKDLKFCQKKELLSYHDFALNKYEKLNIKYPLKNVKVFSSQEFEKIKEYFNKNHNI